jgi:hypothetical protein
MLRRGAHTIALSLATFAAAIASCNLPNKSNNTTGFYVATGSCSGTPTSCAGLSGADCPRVPGCQDTGSCTGTAAATGEACGAMTSYAACSATVGCFWQANCAGQPFGTCSAVTQEFCTAVPGCIWTPYAGTGGTSSVACNTFQAACSADTDCDCGFKCLKLCTSCAQRCAHACLSSADCAGTMGYVGRATPNCQKVDPSATAEGSCAE